MRPAERPLQHARADAWRPGRADGAGVLRRLLRRARSLGSSRVQAKVADLIYARDLLRALVVRDMKIRYESSFLGLAWTFARPLLTLGVLFFVFQVVVVLDVPRFTSFALIGIFVYTWFQSSLIDACAVALSNRDLVRRPRFRVAVLPLVAVTTGLVHFLLALPVLAMVLLFGGSRPDAALLALPAVVMIQFILTTGLAYIAAAVTVFYRDAGHLLNVALTLLFFLSPVFYHADQVPAEFQALYRLNPLVALLEGYRNPLLYGAAPGWDALAIVGAIGAILTVVGCRLFEKASSRFVEEL